MDATEIVRIILPHLNNEDLKNVKFVCKRLHVPASKTLYRNILIYVLVNSQHGEINEVIADLQGLIPRKAQGIFKQVLLDVLPFIHNKHMIHVHSPNHPHKVLMTQYGQVNNGMYLDPAGKQVIHFNHITQQVIGYQPTKVEIDASVEHYRFSFEREAFQYLEEFYPNGATTVYGKQRAGKCIITVAISSCSSEPNSWSGSWSSIWHITFSINGNSDKKAEISGKIQIQVHYYENGNTQLNSNFFKKLQFEVSEPETTAENAFEQIQNIETNFFDQRTLSDIYMHDYVFNGIRRAVVPPRKVDWGKIRNYRLPKKNFFE